MLNRGSVALAACQPAALADDNGSAATHLAEYTCLGLGRAMKVDYTEPDLRYDLDHGTAGAYAGVDAFGRVTEGSRVMPASQGPSLPPAGSRSW